MTDLLRPDLVSKTPQRLWLAATLSGAITSGLLADALLPSSASKATTAPTLVAEPRVSLVPPILILMKTDAQIPPAPPAVATPEPAPIRAAAWTTPDPTPANSGTRFPLDLARWDHGRRPRHR